MAYGLIEWDGSYTPTIIHGDSDEAVEREAVSCIREAYGDELWTSDLIGSTNFLDEFPYPDLDDPQAVSDWLDALREATTIPWFTLLEDDDIVMAA